MRLLFICSSLESGKDGVGDYTMQLCSELAALGHETLAFGWADSHASCLVDKAVTIQGQEIRSIRLSKESDWTERESCLRQLISEFSPEVVSLQYVPWSYGRFGSSRAPARILRKVIPATTHFHLMLHEPWIGARRVDTLKDRLIGTFQKRSIRHLVKSVKPSTCHSSNPYYVQLLTGAGIEARLLPLFGNIPIEKVTANSEVYATIERVADSFPAGSERSNFLLSGVFGTIHPYWDPAKAIESCLGFLNSEGKGRRLVMVMAGRSGAHSKDFADSLKSQFGERVLFARIGELDPKMISELFHELDFGWATNPYALIGKSGSAITMLEHGLPLLVTRNDMPAPPPPPELEHFIAARARLFVDEDFDWAEFLGDRRPPQPMLRAVAEHFLTEIKDT